MFISKINEEGLILVNMDPFAMKPALHVQC